MLDRGLLYGDGFFESILILNGKIPFIQLHFDRIQRTAKKLRMKLSEDLRSISTFRNLLFTQIDQKETCRLRMNIVRNQGGLYLPQNNEVWFNFQRQEVTNPLNNQHKVKKSTFIAESITLFSGGLSNYKTLAKSEQVILSMEMNDRGLNDLIVLNERGHIVELISSNIFFIDREGTHHTPALDSGCLDGVMRKYIIMKLTDLGISVSERSIEISEVPEFIAVYATNAIQGIIPVEKINESTFDTQKPLELADSIIQNIIQ